MRIGIFGGTFDPPHLGHLTLACTARSQLELDRLLWILTPDPPHKLDRRFTPAEHRLAMLRITLRDHPEFTLSLLEFQRPGPHYTVDTVRLLAEQNPASELIYLMGGDELRDLPRWHAPDELLAGLQAIGVLRRPGDSLDLSQLAARFPSLTGKLHYVDAPAIPVSSSDIRARAACGLTIEQFLLPGVFEYILQNQLYPRRDTPPALT
jgi:nicotinate-nucleotide adenylyltransferase